MKDELFESILDDMTADEVSKNSSDVLTADANEATGLPKPDDTDYKFLISVIGGYMISSVIKDAEQMLEFTRDGFLEVLDNCRGISRYSDVLIDKQGAEYTQNDDLLVTFFFSANTQFRKPSDILYFIDNLYIVAQKMSGAKWLPRVLTSTWIRFRPYNDSIGSYDRNYSQTFKEGQLLNRRLKREKNSFVSDDAFNQIYETVIYLLGHSMSFQEFCNFKLTLDGKYDSQKTILFMLSGTIKPVQSYVLPLIARSEVSDKIIDFRNLVLKWTKFTYVFRIPSCVHGETKERVPELMPVRENCEDSVLRDELCDLFENDKNLKIQQPYIVKHFKGPNSRSEQLSIVCRTYGGGVDYILGFVVSVPVTQDDENSRHTIAWLIAGMLREGLSLDAKRAIER